MKSVDLTRVNKGEKINSKILTDMKRMMKYVEQAGRELEVWEEEANAWTPEKVTRLYETIQWKFCIKPQRGTRRFEGLTWITYLKMVNKAGGILVGDNAPIGTNTTIGMGTTMPQMAGTTRPQQQ